MKIFIPNPELKNFNSCKECLKLPICIRQTSAYSLILNCRDLMDCLFEKSCEPPKNKPSKWYMRK
jgi:hypothetical protein